MSKAATVKPDWLHDLLCAWARWHLNRESLGFPRVSPMFMERLGVSAQPMLPTGYSGQDYQHVEDAVEALPMKYKLAITRAYRPWTITLIDAEFPGNSPVTWHRWLTDAAAAVASDLDRRAA